MSEKGSLLATIRADVEATTHPNFRTHRSPLVFWLRAVGRFVLAGNVRVVVIYRLAHSLAERGLWPVAMVLREWGIRTSGCELNPHAEIGPGLFIVHGVGTGVGAHVTIGRNCRMYMGAVVGPQPNEKDPPRRTIIGDNVRIGTHAVVLGGVTIGDGAVIGANALVVRDVAPNTVISASPGRVVGTREASPGSAPRDTPAAD